MKIVSSTKYDLAAEGIISDCDVHCIHVKILDIKKRASEIIAVITDKSWIKKLGVVEQKSYSARSEKTIVKIVYDILNKIEDKVTEDFGEYLVSDSAGNALSQDRKHKKITLAELWKEQKSGNPGFDFHTETLDNLIVFGEAKFKTASSPYTIALDQILEFVENKKDEMELVDLKNFVSTNSVNNFLDNKKGFIAAFSLNAINHKKIFENALKTVSAQKLLCHSELYLIGIEI